MARRVVTVRRSQIKPSRIRTEGCGGGISSGSRFDPWILLGLGCTRLMILFPILKSIYMKNWLCKKLVNFLYEVVTKIHTFIDSMSRSRVPKLAVSIF